MIGAMFICGVVVGYGIGRMLSPVYDDSVGAQLATREIVGLSAEPRANHPPQTKPAQFGIWFSEDEYLKFDKGVLPDGRVKYVRVSPDAIAYVCGVTTYRYDINASKVTLSGTNRREIPDEWRLPRRGLDFIAALTFLAGGLEGYQLRKTLPRYLKFVKRVPAGESVGRRIVSGVLGFGAGVGVGIYFGYRNDFNCASPSAEKLLRSPHFWQGVEPIVRERYEWWFDYTDPRQPVLQRDRGAGNYPYRYRGDLINALANAKVNDKTLIHAQQW